MQDYKGDTMHKHYARLDSDGWIIHAYSDAFEAFTEGDFCIEQYGDRQLKILDEINPPLFTTDGAPIYKFEAGEIIKSEKVMPPKPKTISDSERISILESVIDELVGGA